MVTQRKGLMLHDELASITAASIGTDVEADDASGVAAELDATVSEIAKWVELPADSAGG